MEKELINIEGLDIDQLRKLKFLIIDLEQVILARENTNLEEVTDPMLEYLWERLTAIRERIAVLK